MSDSFQSRNIGPTQDSTWRRGSGRISFCDRRQHVTPKSSLTPSSPSVEPTGTLLASISVHQIQLQSDNLVKDGKLTVEDCKYVASYNWLDKPHATILVPGSPPAWLPPRKVRALKQDSGTYYRDPNAARYPHFPIEPAIRALLALQPEFECPTVDVVGCGNTLGTLLSAALGEERTFLFGVERVGNTIFLLRQGSSPREVIEGVYGYGHTFPEAYTSWDAEVKGSASHQRLVEYRFGNLRFLVRSETDGYFTNKVETQIETVGPAIQTNNDMPSLSMVAESLSVSDKGLTKTSKLTVQLAGQDIPQAAIFDLKTRSARKDVNMDEFLPRLWVNQTPNFIIARHNFGKFEDIQKLDVQASIREWERKNAGVLCRFHTILAKLIEITAQAGCSRIQVNRNGIGALHIRKATQKWSVLPSDLKRVWIGRPAEKEVSANGKSPDLGTHSESDSEEEGPDDYLNF